MSDDPVFGDLGELIGILERETGGAHFNPMEIRSRLDDLMAAAGRFARWPDMSREEIERREAWSEAASDRGPSAREKARHYAMILESHDPFAEGMIHSIYRTEIDALADGRTPHSLDLSHARPHPGNARPIDLTDRLDRDLALFRQVVEELKTYNELSVRSGAPNKGTRQTLLLWLADLYVELTNQDIDRYDLPHAEGSRFIRFCHLAVKPYMALTETSAGSLAKAWQRLKAAEKAATS